MKLLSYILSSLIVMVVPPQGSLDYGSHFSALGRSPQNLKLPPMGSPEQEMLARNAIAHQQSEHKENLERASESARIANELLGAFDRNKSLYRADLKKIDRLEKLIRRIRSNAGGSDTSENLADPPSGLEDGLKRLVELTEDLHNTVEKTPRQVVSAKVIEQAHNLLLIIHHIRGFLR